jgi:2-phospho-L-lactate/phosphoenolpyruvate guanylyltransferase
MRTAAVVPIKSFERAKRRLGEAVGGGDRMALAAAMVGDVLAALDRVPAIADIVVITAEPTLVPDPDDHRPAPADDDDRGRAAPNDDRGRAAPNDDRGPSAPVVIPDPEQRGQSAAAQAGVRAAVERGAERVLLVPGDCPALDPDEVSRLLARGGPPPHVVIVPDRHGSGTNALLLAPPDALAPAFGAGSFARHAARARAAGAAVKVCELPSLGLDVDTPDDLAALRAALAAHPQAAPRTRGVLDRLVAAAAR